jgi:serine protease Do
MPALNAIPDRLSDFYSLIMIKPVQQFLLGGLALALSVASAPLSFAQDDKPVPAPPPVKPTDKLPELRVDSTPLPANTPSYAPVVEKVAPSVVTISTYTNAKAPNRGNAMNNPRGGGNQNPLFNDPMFRRFFGIPEDDNNANPQAPQTPRKRAPRQNDDDNNGAAKGAPRKGGRVPLGLGSGVIVSADGYILTNNHVVEGADDISVTIGNSQHEYKARKVGTDPGSDIAVIKIEGKNLPAVTFSDSDKLRPGDIVIAVGNPFGLTQSATMGVVSAVGRGGMGIVDYENFIQTDASINMGNSGGALVDYEGRLVGINTAIFSRSGGNQGIGFAVPCNLARTVMESILKTGKVTRGFLGVSLQPLTDDLMKAFNLKTDNGALIAEVLSGSPAEKAGIKNGDVVTAVNKKAINNPRELQLLIGSLPPKSKAELTVLRDGKEQNVTVDLGEKNAKSLVAQADAPDADPDVLDGVTVGDLDAETRKAGNIADNVKGVVITEIEEDSASAAAGLHKGDVILEVNREPVTSSKQAVEMSEKLKKAEKVLLRVYSRGATRYVTVERK